MIDLAKEIWQTMTTNKLRTILTGVSVAWGIFMLILLVAIANGVLLQSEESMMKNDPFRISVWSGRASMAYKGLKEGRNITFRNRDLQAIEDVNSDYIESASATINYMGQISTNRDYLSSSRSSGVYPTYFSQQYKFILGRPINDADIQNNRKVIVLHEKDAKILFPSVEAALGGTVKVGELAFKVVGIYEHDWSEGAYIPYTTAYALNGYNGQLNNINVHLKNVTSEEQSAQAEEQTRQALAKAENFDPQDQGAAYTYDRFASYLSSLAATKYLTYTMWIIGILTLITGIVGVSNIMFVSVRERTHEIGIRRAIGAKPRKILSQIIIESVALTTCFGYIGIVLGVAVTELLKKVFENVEQFPLRPTVDIAIAIEVTIALIIAGALAGVFPALRALKVKPVEALRDE